MGSSMGDRVSQAGLLMAMCALLVTSCEGGTKPSEAVETIVKETKRKEAIYDLMQMRKGMIDELDFVLSEMAPGVEPPMPSTTEWTPAGTPCDHPEDRFPGDESDWKADGWRAARFFLNVPHHYQYRIEALVEGKTIKARFFARGDLDCDGTYSMISLPLEYSIDSGRWSEARVEDEGEPLE